MTLSNRNNKIGTVKKRSISKKLLIPTIALCIYQILGAGNIGITNAQAASNESRTKDKINKEFQNKWKAKIDFMNNILSNKIQPNTENQVK